MQRLIPYVSTAFEIYSWLIIIRVFLFYLPHNPYQPVFRFIYEVTEPLLLFCRRLLPLRTGLDFSPFVAIVLISVMETIFIRLLQVF